MFSALIMPELKWISGACLADAVLPGFLQHPLPEMYVSVPASRVKGLETNRSP
jgi:hypothetical protein